LAEKILRIVFTQEEKKVVRRNIDGFRQSYIIDTREMILEHDYVPDEFVSSPNDFIVQQEIEKKLKQAVNNKKSKQVIYFHYDLSRYLIENIRDFFIEHDTTFELAIFDHKGELKHLYDLFDCVLTRVS
jgi:hypothetical protein